MLPCSHLLRQIMVDITLLAQQKDEMMFRKMEAGFRDKYV
jgi:hypothetical protein